MNQTPTLELFALGDICRATGQPPHRIEYVIASRRIQPVRRAGASNLYDTAAMEQIRIALAATQAAHERRAARAQTRAPEAAVA